MNTHRSLARSAMVAMTAAALGACQLPPQRVPAGPAVVGSDYLVAGNETLHACVLEGRELQRYAPPYGSLLRAAVIQVAASGSKIGIDMTFSVLDLGSADQKQVVAVKHLIHPTVLHIGPISVDAGAFRQTVGLEIHFVSTSRSALEELYPSLRDGSLSFGFEDSRSGQAENWLFPKLVTPMDQAHLAAFASCLAQFHDLPLPPGAPGNTRPSQATSI